MQTTRTPCRSARQPTGVDAAHATPNPPVKAAATRRRRERDMSGDDVAGGRPRSESRYCPQVLVIRRDQAHRAGGPAAARPGRRESRWGFQYNVDAPRRCWPHWPRAGWSWVSSSASTAAACSSPPTATISFAMSTDARLCRLEGRSFAGATRARRRRLLPRQLHAVIFPFSSMALFSLPLLHQECEMVRSKGTGLMTFFAWLWPIVDRPPSVATTLRYPQPSTGSH